MTARSTFLGRWNDFRQAIDEPAIIAPNSCGDFIRKGLTVAAFNLLEGFIEARLVEVAAEINSGVLQFRDFPEPVQIRIIKNTLTIASSRLKYVEKGAAEQRDYAREVGLSLAAVDRSIRVSPFAWSWQGSNISAADYAAILRAFHCEQPYAFVARIANSYGLPTVSPASSSPINFQSVFEDLVKERNRCAHEASYGVTSTFLRTVPSSIFLFASALDIALSFAVVEMRRGSASFLADTNWLGNPSRFAVRPIRERARDFAEFPPRSPARASRTFAKTDDTEMMLRSALSRCGPTEAVVRFDRGGLPDAWAA